MKRLAFIVVVFNILLSCESNQNEDESNKLRNIIQNNLGKTLILPDRETTIIYSPYNKNVNDSIWDINPKYKIYSYINVSCGTCIRNIGLWDKFVLEFKKYNVPIILICGSDDNFELFYYLCESGSIEQFYYPFLLDKKGQFIQKNNFMKEIEDFKTVLVDINNKILLMGNPVFNSEIKKLYMKTISGE